MAPDAQPPQKIKVLFVCMGNICRSPSAEGVFRAMVQTSGLKDYVEVASAGTHAYHVGEQADPRSRKAAASRNIDIENHRAQHLKKKHFEEYDYIVVMDHANHRNALEICPPGHCDKLHYFMDFAPQLNVKEVPDPYFGGVDGFEHVLDLIEAASAGLMSDIRERHIDPPPVHKEITAG